jgi:predicted MFS family arabinose efflux permease
MLASWFLKKFNIKWVLWLSMFLNISSLVVFTLIEWLPGLAMCRFFNGLFQVFFCIYFPVWADVYGDEIQKSKWLTYLLISSPLGVISGYGLTAALLNNIGWRWSFYI